MLTNSQFEILCHLKMAEGRDRPPLTLPELMAAAPLSPADTDRTLSLLRDRGLIRQQEARFLITEAGVQALAPYRVRRAVILAAGFGSRLRPLTLETPKPLLRVHGVRIVDTLLDAFSAAGIKEVLLVRGYLGEKFRLLRAKYPFVTFLDNPLYTKTNNISTALCAREWLQNAYICDADLYLRNPGLIRPYEYCSNYLGAPVGHTDDWCLEVRDGIIQSMKKGGSNCYQMYGLSYWSAQDGEQLGRDLERVFRSPDGTQRFWDEVPLNLCQNRYKVALRTCRADDILEIDTLEELYHLDSSYCPLPQRRPSPV